jgi:hypothetical protein
MKFYKYNDDYYSFFYKIIDNNLTAIYYGSSLEVDFYKNGKVHNCKNAAVIADPYKGFYLNGKMYGTQISFTKKSWRKFVKLQAFL